MNILYIAYSCSPNHGSEDRIGWKIPLASAENNRVFVITKEEHRAEIENYRKQHPMLQAAFFYVDIPAVYKKIFRGFAYSGRLNVWHRRAVALAEQICVQKKIDIIHQITPVEFRSIGDYGRIPNVKFVCGPIGGGEYIPEGLAYYARRHLIQEAIRKMLNRFSLLALKRNGILKRCDAVLFANEETKQYLKSVPCAGMIYKSDTETGIDTDEIMKGNRECRSDETCNFLVAGRLIYRKGHEFLLDALGRLPEELEYTCTVVGSGPELPKLKQKCEKMGLDRHVRFIGSVPFGEMAQIYRNSHALIMPSIRETTGSVLLEAMSKGLPIITIDRFGGAAFLDETVGWLYNGNVRDEFVDSLKDILIECIAHPEDVRRKGENALSAAKEHLWNRKVAFYQDIYAQLVVNEEE